MNAQHQKDSITATHEASILDLLRAAKYSLALQLYDSSQMHHYSDKLHGELLVACKEVGKSKLALAICDWELQRNPRSYYWNLKKIHFLTYDNQLKDATTLLAQLKPEDELYYDVSMILASANNDWLLYKEAAEQLLFRFNRKQAYNDVLEAFNKLNAFQAAKEWIRIHTLQLQQIDTTLLYFMEARLWLIWANQSTLNETEKYEFSKNALIQIDRILMSRSLQRTDSARVLYDKLNALYNMGEYNAAFSLYKSIIGEKPLYIQLMAATAALEGRQVQDARNLFETILASPSIEIDPYIQYTYVLSDLNKYEQAIQLLDSLISKQPNFVIRKGKPLDVPNYDKLYLTIQKAKVLYYGGYFKSALSLLDTLMVKMPLDFGLFQIKGNILDARGHHQEATKAYKTALWNNRNDAGLFYNVAGNYFAQNQYLQTDSILLRLKKEFPFSATTKRLEKEWKEFNMHSIEFVAGFSNTYGLIQNGHGYSWGMNYISKPIHYNWNILASTQQNFAEIPEGEILLTKYRAGLQFKKNNFEARAQTIFNRFGENEVGFSLDASYFFANKHTIFASLQRLSEQQPLRGLFYGITANQYGLAYTYRPNELIRTSVQYDRFNFTDNNIRNAWVATVEGKIYHHSAFQLIGIGQLYSSNNRSNNVTYFSPLSDFSTELSLRMDHTIMRRYEFSYSHSLQLSTAYYQQKNFAGGLIGGVSYKQELQLSYTKSIWLRGTGGNRLFDGNKEPYFHIDIGVNAKF